MLSNTEGMPHRGVKCSNCAETIVSRSRHDFKFCKCGTVAVDGGYDYLRIVGDPDKYTIVEAPNG